MTKSIKRMVAIMAMFFMVIGMIVSITEGAEVSDEIETTREVTTEEQEIGYTAKPLLLTREETEVEVTEVTTAATTAATTEITTETTTETTTKKSVQTTTLVQTLSTTKVAVTEPTKKTLKEGTVVDPKLKESEIVLEEYEWEGKVLNSYNGTVAGPNGKETYYNLRMTGVISIMERLGYDYKYWVREDGVKMYGPFIMVAANLNIRPRGSIIKTSLGWGLVCDTGDFAKTNPTQIDIAVCW